MNANRQFDEDDLVLYAMRLLAEPDHAEMAAYVAANPDAQRRLGEVQLALGIYAEASVQPQPLPTGSLERLLARVDDERRSSAINGAGQTATEAAVSGLAASGPALVPRATAAATTTSPATSLQPKAARSSYAWAAMAGWGIAAALAVTAGLTLQQRSSLREAVEARNAQVAALHSDTENLRRERDTLRANLSSQEQRLANSSSALEATQNQAAALKNEADSARSTAANLQANLSGESAKLNAERARAAAAEQERNRLQGTLAAQADQLAALQSSTSNAEVVATLTDPSALRVVLTKPKSKPAPVGRAAYVAGKGSLVFIANNLEQLKANKVYELWLLPADGGSPVGAGTFVPDAKGNAHLVYARFPRAIAAKGFAITVENAGGANTPTLPLILAGS